MTMIKKHTTKLLILLVSVSLSSLTTANQSSGDETIFKEGQHYSVLKTPIKINKDNGEKIELIYAFNFFSPIGREFDEYFDNYSNPKAIIERRPVIWDKRLFEVAQAYYAGALLGLESEARAAIYEALSSVQNRGKYGRIFTTEDEVIKFLENLGVESSIARKQINSLALNSKLRHTYNLTLELEIEAPPTIIVNGIYKTSLRQAGTKEELVRLINWLIEKG
jgi:thiol:disulfide interchange protein DsbA